MRRVFLVLSILFVIGMVSGCGGIEEVSPGVKSNGKQSSTKDEVLQSEGNKVEIVDEEESQDINELDAVRKAEPRQVPTQFPLPILDGWVEGVPFGVESKGGWFAEYHYEDDPKDNAKRYDQLLSEQGYDVMAHGLVEMSLGHGYYVKGHISGIHYLGVVVFDTNAEGQPRVWMEFNEEEED